MKHAHKSHGRLKVIGIGIAALLVGIGLIVISFMIAPSPQEAEAASPAATLPASSAPATTQPTRESQEESRRRASAQNMSNLVFMFGTLSFGVTAICAGWVVYDIRRSRPAWMTQTKFPRKR
ncbi:MAG TPA: hypothetical protein PKY77_09540 [Phycisphaerae bacterium]|nr:hypothetical protein [Phycisphaerae bacterium]HRY69852.1 hypothetical protein [Phycisphaerae bacterium]HSA25421.1 hypothetical protein [Phycisphaerae bacterium]